MGLTYAEALQALQSRGRFGIRLGLGRTRAILRAMGDPHRSFRGALIAGTNGKGSVLALTSAALRAAGLLVATTPKPHLVSYRERATFDGQPIDRATFADLVSEVLPVADKIARRLGDPTEFELLTAVIFRWFAEVEPDVAIVEVGLGGRLDATHVWDGGVAAVTNVSLDHMDRLGSTIPAIAREKAAIIMPGDLAVTGATGEALSVVRRRARGVRAPLTEVSPAPLLGWDRDSIAVELSSMGPTRVGLRGRHQAANVAVADAVLDALEAAGIATVPLEARRAGYAAVRWPGRLELLDVDGREVLLDGAHNAAGAETLARALDDLGPYLTGVRPETGSNGDGVALVMAMMADKDVDAAVAALSGSAALRQAAIICTQLEVPRALPGSDLADRWRALDPDRTVYVEPGVDGALRRALDSAGTVVVAGSLYLVGAVRKRLVDDPELRDDEGMEADAMAMARRA